MEERSHTTSSAPTDGVCNASINTSVLTATICARDVVQAKAIKAAKTSLFIFLFQLSVCYFPPEGTPAAGMICSGLG